jgi:predicted dehydrogenase
MPEGAGRCFRHVKTFSQNWSATAGYFPLAAVYGRHGMDVAISSPCFLSVRFGTWSLRTANSCTRNVLSVSPIGRECPPFGTLLSIPNHIRYLVAYGIFSPTSVALLKMEKLVGVLIGCGGIARRHLTAIAELPHVEVAAVCDTSAARAEATAERFGIAKWFSSSRQLLAEVNPNLVHITTPPSSHFSIAKACLTAKLNVLCEKPITTDYHEFEELKELAIKNSCLLMENQNFRYHSSIRRICDLLLSGKLGDLVDVQLCLSTNILAPGSPFVDSNAPHYSLSLRGGAIGDFLTHLAYLTYMFTGAVTDMRTTWRKRLKDSPLPADEFRAFIKGERATAYVAFNGNVRPYGFWIRVTGTQMHVEANLYEPPRLTVRRLRNGEPAVMSLIDGIAESRDVLFGTVAGFWRKLAGTGSYDGLPELIARTYHAIGSHEPSPIHLAEIDTVARIVDRFTSASSKL